MTNREAAAHFAAKAPEETATVLLWHPDTAYYPTGCLHELDEAEVAGLEDKDRADYVGEVAVDTSH